ncbi:SBBP repeat-containing protein, partial [Planctomycetota bacterium]
MRRLRRKIAQVIAKNSKPPFWPPPDKALKLEALERRVLLNAALPIAGASEQLYQYGWTDTFGGIGGEYPYDIAINSQGQIFVTGFFEGTVDFDPTSGTKWYSSNGARDIFVTKLQADGGYGWTATFGGTADDIGRSVAVDDAGNIFVTGSFEDSNIDFDPTIDGTDPHSSNGDTDIFVTKLKDMGNSFSYGWTATCGSNQADQGNGIVVYTVPNPVSDVVNVWVTGEFTGTVDFDPTTLTDSRTSNGSTDFFLTKLIDEGVGYSYNEGWTKTIGGSRDDYANDIAVDSLGHLYITGRFESTVNFNPDDDFPKNYTSIGLFDIFVTKWSSSHHYDWTQTFGGSGWDEAHSISVDSKRPEGLPIPNSVLVTGEFSETVDFNPDSDPQETDVHISSGGRDIFVTKLDTSGNYHWTATMGGIDHDYGKGLATDLLGNVSVTGYYQGEADFDPSPQPDTHTSNGQNDFFVTQLNTDGDYSWTATAGGSENEFGISTAVDPSGSVVIAGTFQDTVDFNPIDGTDIRISNGEYDIFISKLSNSNTDPAIGSLTAHPNPVARGDDLTLTANDVIDIDGIVVKARFYRDSDGNGQLDTAVDTLLDEFVLDVPDIYLIVPTDTFPLGNNIFFAQVQDNQDAWSNIARTTVWLNDPPTIDSLLGDPDPVLIGADLTLTANNVNDSDGTVTKVEFYLDANNNGVLETSGDDHDVLLGIDTDGSDGWTWTGSTSGFDIDTNYCFARAQDNHQGWSAAADTTVLVFNPPTMDAQLLDKPDPVVKLGDNLTLTAVNVHDNDGVVPEVEFYLDDGDYVFDAATDIFLGTGAQVGDEWSWTGPTTNDFNVGLNLNQYFARARDDDNPNAWSNIAATFGRVNDRPTFDLLLTPNPVIQGNNLE